MPSESVRANLHYGRPLSIKRAGTVFAACVLASGSARAEVPDSARSSPLAVVRFAFWGADGCPTEQDFVAQVSTRTAHFRIAGPAERARTFFVTVKELPDDATDRFVGALMVQEEDGRKSERSLAGADCAQVATALSIVIAIELDPEAAAREPKEPPPVTPVAPPPPPRVQMVERSPWRVGAILGGGLVSALAPTLAGSAELSIELRRESPRLLAPVFRFGFAFSGNSTHRDVGSAQIVVFTPSLEACPVQLALAARRLIFEPCARMTAGFYYAQGSTPTPARGQNQLAIWGSLGAVVRALWLFAGPVFFEVDGEILAPLERDRFYFGEVRTSPLYFQAPPVGFRGTIGVGVHFL